MVSVGAFDQKPLVVLGLIGRLTNGIYDSDDQRHLRLLLESAESAETLGNQFIRDGQVSILR